MVGGQADDLGSGFTRASGGANILTRSVGGLGTVMAALGIVAVTDRIRQFGINSVKTAGELDQLQRALVNMEEQNCSLKKKRAYVVYEGGL